MKPINRLAETLAFSVATIACAYAGEIELKKLSALKDAMAISDDGRVYLFSVTVTAKPGSASTIEHKLSVKDAKSGSIVKSLDWKTDEWGRPADASFSPNNKRLLVIHRYSGGATKDGAKVFDLDTGEMTFNVRHDLLKGAVFTPDGNGVLSTGTGAIGVMDSKTSLWLWDIGSRKKTVMDGPGHSSRGIAVSPNGKFVAATDFGVRPVVIVCDAKSGKRVCELEGHAKDLNAVAFAADSKTIATGDQEGIVRLWSIPSGKPLADYDDHQEEIISLSFAPKQKLLASSGRDRTIKLFDTSKKKVVATKEVEKADAAFRLHFSNDGNILVARPEFFHDNGPALVLWAVHPSK
jgi:WD40 repeat protein